MLMHFYGKVCKDISVVSAFRKAIRCLFSIFCVDEFLSTQCLTNYSENGGPILFFLICRPGEITPKVEMHIDFDSSDANLFRYQVSSSQKQYVVFNCLGGKKQIKTFFRNIFSMN